MNFFDQINKTLSQGLDRAKIEADRLQKTLRLQNEVGEMKHQLEVAQMELGARAFDLYKAGQIQSPTLGALVQNVDNLRAQITLKEEEQRQTQDAYENATKQAAASSGPPPSSVSTPPPASTTTSAASAPVEDTKACPNCQYHMPAAARFCPNCGARVSA